VDPKRDVTKGMTVTDEVLEFDDAPLVAKLIPLLADGAAHTFERLFDAVVDVLPADTDEAEEVLDSVLDGNGRFISLDDERWIDLHTLLEGRCFTHRLTPAEAAAAVIPLRPDIDIATVPFMDPIPFTGGAEGAIVFAEDLPGIDAGFADELQGGGLSGPKGWLGQAGEGAVVGVWFGDGALECRAAEPDPALTQPAAAALAAVFGDIVEHEDDPVDLIELMVTWLVGAPDALRTALEPVSVLLEAAGLEHRGDFVGRAGTGWLTPHQRLRIEERALHTQVYGFDECCHDALELAQGVFHGAIRDAAPRDVATALSHGSVAEAFVTGMIRRAGHHLDEMAKQMVGFADELIVASRGVEAAGPLYVQSVAFDCLGEAVEAEAAARAALRAEPAHRAAGELMATFLEDRGDAARALDHLRRAGVRDDDPQWARLVEIAGHAGPKVARNDPCTCGSGKKYKACCIDKPRVPAALQAHWLYEKAIAFVMHPARRGGPIHLAIHALDQEGSDDSPITRASQDRRFAELSLFEEGELERYLDERQPLLPATDVAMIEGWVEQPLGLFEVVEVHAGEWLSLRDMQSDETVRVVGTTAIQVVAGDVLVARPLPVGSDLWLGGPVIQVPEGLLPSVEPMIGRPDAHTWAEWIGFAQAPQPAGGEPREWQPSHHHHH
jgi:SEC-C motif